MLEKWMALAYAEEELQPDTTVGTAQTIRKCIA